MFAEGTVEMVERKEAKEEVDLPSIVLKESRWLDLDLPSAVLEPVHVLLRLQEERLPVGEKEHDTYIGKGTVVDGHLKSWKSTIHLDRMLFHLDGRQCNALLGIVNAVMIDVTGCDLAFQLGPPSALQGDWLALTAYHVNLELPLSSVAVARDEATIVVETLKATLLGSRFECSGGNSDKHGIVMRSGMTRPEVKNKQTGQWPDNDQLSDERWRKTSLEVPLTQLYINSVTVQLLAGMESSWLAGSRREGAWRPHKKGGDLPKTSQGSLSRAVGDCHEVLLQMSSIRVIAVVCEDQMPGAPNDKGVEIGLHMPGCCQGMADSSELHSDAYGRLRACRDPALWIEFQGVSGILRLENSPASVHKQCATAPTRLAEVSRVSNECLPIVLDCPLSRCGSEGALNKISWNADLRISLAETGVACFEGDVSDELYEGERERVREERRWVEKSDLHQLGGSAISIQSVHWTMTRDWQESEQCDVGSAAEMPSTGDQAYKRVDQETQDGAIFRVHEIKDAVELIVPELMASFSKDQYLVLLRFVFCLSAQLRRLPSESRQMNCQSKGNEHKVPSASTTSPIRTTSGDKSAAHGSECANDGVGMHTPTSESHPLPSASMTLTKCRSRRTARIQLCKLSAEMELWRESQGTDSASSSLLLLAAQDLVMDDVTSSGYGKMKRRRASLESAGTVPSVSEILEPIGWRGKLADDLYKHAHVFEMSLSHFEMNTRRTYNRRQCSASAGSGGGLQKNERMGMTMPDAGDEGSDFGVDEDLSCGDRGHIWDSCRSYSVVCPLVVDGNASASGIPQKSQILSLSWESGICEMDQAEVTIGPLDYQVDPQLLEELITVVWERRRCGCPLCGVDTFPVSVNARVICGPCRICTVSSLEGLGCRRGGNRRGDADVVGLFLTVEHCVGILHNTLASDVRRWAGVHALAESVPGDTQVKGGAGTMAFPEPATVIGACQSDRDCANVNDGKVSEENQLIPTIVPGSALKVQNFEFSVIGTSASVMGPGLSIPALVIDHADLHVGGTVSGNPVPITIHLDVGHLGIQVCPLTAQLITNVLLALGSSWGKTASMRMACAGPVMPTDDLRSGIFMRAEGGQQRAGKGEVMWADTRHLPQNHVPGGNHLHLSGQQQPMGGVSQHGWITWRYPFERHVGLVTITGSLRKEMKVASSDVTRDESRSLTMIYLQLSAFDRTLGRFVEAAPLAIACIEDWQRIVISTSRPISAEEWLLSWAIQVDRRMPGSERGDCAETGQGSGFVTAIEILKMVEVNPTTATYDQKVWDGTAVVPFLRMDLKAQYMQVAFMERPEQGEALEVIQIQGQGVKVDFLMWSPLVWRMLYTGMMKGEFLHRACGTYETAVEPCHLSSVLEMRVIETSMEVAEPASIPLSSTGGSQTTVPWTAEGQGVGDHSRPMEIGSDEILPTKEGFRIRVNVDGEMSIRVQDAAIVEVQRMVGLCSRQRNNVQSPGNTAITSSGWKGNGSLGYTVKNECPVDIVFGQDGTREGVLLKAETSCSYTWAVPPSLHPSGRTSLRIRIAEPLFESGIAGGKDICRSERRDANSMNQSSWSPPFSIDDEGVVHRGMPLGTEGVVGVVIEVRRGPRMMVSVVIKPGQRIVNHTASTLLVKLRGFLPTEHPRKLASEPKSIRNEGIGPTGKRKAFTVTGQGSPESCFMQRPLFQMDERVIEVPSHSEESGSKKNCTRVLCLIPGPSLQRLQVNAGGHAVQGIADKGCTKPQLSFCLGGDGMWSKWVDLPEFTGVSQISTLLVSTEKVVEWDTTVGNESDEVPAGPNFLWCQMSFLNAPVNKELTVMVWPPFLIHNALYQDLEARTGSQGGQQSSIRAVRHGRKVPLAVTASGVQYLSVRIMHESGERSSGISALDTDLGSLNSPNYRNTSKMRSPFLYGVQDQHVTERGRATAGLWSLSLRLLVWKQKAGQKQKKGADQVMLLVPGLGDHKMLSLTMGGRNHQKVPVILTARLLQKGIPCVVLSFLPQAVIHNHLPVPIRITTDANISLGLATEVDPASKALFNWRETEDERHGSRTCMAKIALVFSAQRKSPLYSAPEDGWPISGATARPTLGEEERQQPLASVWWLSPVNLEAKNLTCASTIVANQEYRVVVRTTFESFGDYATSDAETLRCCHVAVYPWAVVSNMSKRDLYVGVGHLVGLCEPGSSLRSSVFLSRAGAHMIPVMTLGCGNQLPEEGSDEWQGLENNPRGLAACGSELFRLAIPGGTHAMSPAAAPVSSKDEEIPLVRHHVDEDSAITLNKGDGRGRTVTMMGPWSAPFVASSQICRQRVLLTAPDGEGAGHDVMLTCTAVYADAQVHLIMYEDPFPLVTVTNGLDLPVEVCCSETRKVQPDRAVIVRPRSSVDCDWEIGESSTDRAEDNPMCGHSRRSQRGEWEEVEDGEGNEAWKVCRDDRVTFEEELDEEMWLHMKKGPKRGSIFFRVHGEEWLPPIELSEAMVRRHRILVGKHQECFLLVEVSRAGPTYSVEIRQQRESEENCASSSRRGNILVDSSDAGRNRWVEGRKTEPAAKKTPVDNVHVDVYIEALRIRMCDDERSIFRGWEMEYAQVRKGRMTDTEGGGSGGDSSTEIAVMSVDGVHVSITRQMVGGAVQMQALTSGALYHPLFTVVSLNASAQTIQLDSFLPNSEMPVVLTTEFMPTKRPVKVDTGTVEPPGFYLAFEACGPPQPSGEGGFDAQRLQWWIHHIRLSLKPLMLNVDDELIALIERLQRHYSDRSVQRLTRTGVEGSHPVGDGNANEGGNICVASDREEADDAEAQHYAKHGWEKGEEMIRKDGSPDMSAAPERYQDFTFVEPRLFIGEVRIEEVSLLVTLRISRPVVLGTHRSPVILSRLHIVDVLHPPAVIFRSVLARYVLEILYNMPSVLGSLELLFNPTGLVKSIHAGLRDLVRMPLQEGRAGLPGFLYGLGRGGVSLVSHMSLWSLTSIAGFSSALSLILDRACYDDGMKLDRSLIAAAVGRGKGKGAPHRHLSHRRLVGLGIATGLAGLGQGIARGVSGVVTAPLKGAARGGGSGLILGVGKGLLGAIAGPVSGALQLVAQTSNGIIGARGMPMPWSARRQQALVESEDDSAGDDSAMGASSGRWRSVREEWSGIRARYLSRSSRWRLARIVLGNDSERYHSDVEVFSAVVTGGTRLSPRHLARPLLVLTSTALYALECRGCAVVAQLPLTGLEVDEDPVEMVLTIAAGEEGQSRGTVVQADRIFSGNGEEEEDEGDDEREGEKFSSQQWPVQLYVTLDRFAWTAWLPGLRRLVTACRRS
ncbi:hypothetical protein CBR_g31856 [Chara braunii]|uniref:Uncharacterized protein n=1 Tax=Chara braunii TaxID=69332 RepID=A0A388LFW1_CHABU|nr:hypothetical protein CBR_g31856 [Chara braunii]|eukprot:GBG81181.1 hypothetical protein CBR_g31856 [Chara braunii]